MRTRLSAPICILCLALLALLHLGRDSRVRAAPPEAAGSPNPAGQAGSLATDVRVDPTGYTAAQVCGSCHAAIYDSWKRSLHAFALSDPIFDTAYMLAVKDGGAEAGRLCLRCHAPMTTVNGDYELRLGVTREGVSCDFCHTVTAVHLDGRDKPYDTAPGLVKRSILRKAASPAHEVAYSDLHGKSEFCGGCHNYVTAGGAAIMSTYDEWRRGPYPVEGVQCQDCHMVLGPGRVVREGLAPSAPQAHLHDLIHDSNQLRSALSLQIVSVERVAGGLEIEVAVENVGSGHMVPTGLPTREVILSVTVEESGRSQTRERRYRKVVADAQGSPLGRSDVAVLMRGVRIVSDNRIAPRERRIERFTVNPPRSRGAKVSATLTYDYSPVMLKEQKLEVTLGEAERYVQ